MKPRISFSAGIRMLSFWAAALLAVLSLDGCTYKAWLDADSSSDDPGQFRPGPQYVHVGEPVRLQFLVAQKSMQGLVYGMDNYMILDLPTGKVVVEASREYANYIQKVEFAQPGSQDGCVVTATGYRTRGEMDVQMINGTIEHKEFSSDAPDDRLASASITLIVYQSRVQIPHVGGAGIEPDWAKSELWILADDGKRVSKIVKSGLPGQAADQPGYTVEGPDDKGEYTVSTLPLYSQINRGGTTAAEMHLVDAKTGKVHISGARFRTP
ncbi:MAG: hypothetical protein BIFFINMI_00403 [Phycisphaerae bacterium]|nr:hypothetical protein [Phycisphaerae bacterium]